MPGYRKIELGLRMELEPKEVRDQILVTYEGNACNAEKTAEALGITYRTFWRYCARLKLHTRLEALQKKAKKDGVINQLRRRTK